MRKKITISVVITLIVVTIGWITLQSNTRHEKQSLTVKPGILTIGLEGTFAPFSYRQHGKLTGFEVELSEAVAKKMNLKPKYVETKWDSLITGLDANRYDVIFNDIGITPERKKNYLFSTPYIYSKTVLIKQSNNLSLNHLTDLNHKKMAQSTTSNFGTLAQKNGANIVAVPGIVEAMNLITTNRVDGTLNDLGAYNTWKKSNPNAKTVAIDISKESPAIPAAPLIQKNNKILQKHINSALTELNNDGTLKSLSMKYFDTDLTTK
ncbi:transporter substrate-binding domain-containing protein [Leuconostoc palmae]|uniref:transporter substrate-binding domain-containing protein n=1 Tax=Leuconostoc palmae TaxID=501487 RepID=UPI001C7D6170|nr:transporter substrate-binding domain-containing protein [Leuconostoc palmae]